MFKALGIRNFRVFALSQVTSTTSLWVQRIAQDWLVMELTGSVTAVGLLVMVQLGPWVLLGPWGGVIADRYNKRLLMVAAQSVTGVAAGVAAVLWFSGHLHIWTVFLLAAVVGLMSIVEQPARLVFVGEIADGETLGNAVSLNQAAFQVSGVLGPILSGALVSGAGQPWPFVASCAGHAVSISLLLAIDRSQLAPIVPVTRSRGQLLEAVRFILRTPQVKWIFGLVLTYSVFAHTWPVLLAPMAGSVFETGAEGYGLYNAAVAAGALVGALLAMRRLVVQLRHFMLTLIAATMLKALSALAPAEWVFVCMIAGSGLFMVMMWTAANPLLQLATTRDMRGRVMALFLVAINGGEAVGAPLLGVAVDAFGPRTAILLAGLIPCCVAVAAAVRTRRSGWQSEPHGDPIAGEDPSRFDL